MKIAVERVKFILPKNKEYQFPAISVVQEFLATWDKKMKDNDVSGGVATYKLECCIAMPADDVAFFKKAGLVLAHQDDLVGNMPRPDMLCDFSDERIERYRDSNKHVGQICQMLCGGHNASFMPKLRTVMPKLAGAWAREASAESLLSLQDNEITGIIGVAGTATALAACMGLGVVEIIPYDRPLTWLSKFGSRYYRVIREGDTYEPMIKRAIASIEKEMKSVVRDDETSVLDINAGVRRA